MQPSGAVDCGKKGLNCLSEASFLDPPQAIARARGAVGQIVGGFSFAYFSLAAKEKYESHINILLETRNQKHTSNCSIYDIASLNETLRRHNNRRRPFRPHVRH